MSTTIPTPSVMAQFVKPVVTTALSVDTQTTTVSDGVVKAKHLESGMTVKAWLHDSPRGTERTVESAVRNDDGSMVTVTFTNPELTEAERVRTYKAAYRFYCEALVGTSTTEPRTNHLTHRPFENLEGSI